MTNPFTTAVFYPTSYGSVTTLVSGAEAAEFEHALPVATTTQPGEEALSGTQLYQVDLRELELKAAKLREETARAERELLGARMKQRTKVPR